MAKNEPQQKSGLSAGATQGKIEIQGLLITFSVKSLLMGLTEKTVKNRLSLLKLLLKRGVDLLDPENVFTAIDHAKQYDHKTKTLRDEEWSDGSKNNACQAYKSFCKTVGINIPSHINFNKYSRRPQKIPFIPLEKEIETLIGGCSRKVATFLKLLKETGMRSGEAWRLKWTEVDTEHGLVTVNQPEKKGLPRQFKISSKLKAMLNMLPKTSQKAFGNSQLNSFRKNYSLQRRRIAFKMQNPRLERITFHTLRHFFGTMEYHKTQSLRHVQERLGHRDLNSTVIYTHLVNLEEDEYHTATAKNLKEDRELLEAGFEYVTDRNGINIYRKRK